MFFKLLIVIVNSPIIKKMYFPNNKIDNNIIDNLINPVIVFFLSKQ